ncbi:hypothetical protein GALMADRAFT_160257 [Galerina marginata CBS 339.88]|uniref:Uncharacterized protein n=1 Tax=Galerina marginata (strain CBS 339.88) TaxID=685588 RepID=A0A067SSK0_GALM3|nr:hypothetical protein GALMADRAFT_160257 [Galerina marginata CBS 339.88]
MPVTFIVAKHDANPVPDLYRPCRNSEDLLAKTWGEKSRTTRASELLQSSLVEPDFSTIVPEQNGFVDTIVAAYNGHQHLVLRPDDVWIAILGQFNFYVNAHAEDLRKHFVAHEGKKKLVVRACGTRYTVDFGDLARQMVDLIHRNVVDKELKDWILPNFSTTSHNDTVVCAVMMMATLKAYFSYMFQLDCGIPSVTLEGEKSDWEKLLARLDKLESFGPEPTVWASLLRPILKRFVSAFDGEPDLDFWGKVCHFESGGSGPTWLSGWITAFCVWTSEGKWQGPPMSRPLETWIPTRGSFPLTLDDVTYEIIDSSEVPPGFCEVDVVLDDNGDLFDCLMVSGHLAGKVEGDERDTLRPFPSWFMFIKEECEDPEEVALRKAVERLTAKNPNLLIGQAGRSSTIRKASKSILSWVKQCF